MIVRRAVRVVAWGTIGLLLLTGISEVWDEITAALNFAGMQYPFWDIARSLLEQIPQRLIPPFLGIGVGGVFLLIADIHERLHKEAN